MPCLDLISQGYFSSKNCMRELVSCVVKRKPIIALLEPEASHGGLRPEEIKTQLSAAEDSYAKWGFAKDAPRADVLFAALFASEPIEWNRIGAFQDATYYLLLTPYYLLLTTVHWLITTDY